MLVSLQLKLLGVSCRSRKWIYYLMQFIDLIYRLLRFLLGVVIAGMWPGMAYYLTLFYPPSRTGKRIGQYFTAAQVSAAVVGLVSAGFQEMDGLGGLVGFQWMFLLYGLCAVILGFVLLWWLPDRPLPPGEQRTRTGLMKWLPATPPVLTGEDAEIHYQDLTRVYHPRPWTLKDLGRVLLDWRLWPLVLMYFGVVGVGIGTQLYGTVIISGINPNFSGITLSLLFAPIWIVRISPILQYEWNAKNALDGLDRNSSRDPYFRSFPSPPSSFLLGSRLYPNHWSAYHHICPPFSAMGTIRWAPHGWLWSWSNCPHLHDMDERDFPMPTWRGWGGSRFRTSIGLGKSRQYHDNLCFVHRLARGCSAWPAPVSQKQLDHDWNPLSQHLKQHRYDNLTEDCW